MRVPAFLLSSFKSLIILFIKFYKYFISPLLPPACRFQPTCSEYAIEAIKKHGLIVGSFYSLKRLLRCNPLFKGGLDLVPEEKGKRECQTFKD